MAECNKDKQNVEKRNEIGPKLDASGQDHQNKTIDVQNTNDVEMHEQESYKRHNSSNLAEEDDTGCGNTNENIVPIESTQNLDSNVKTEHYKEMITKQMHGHNNSITEVERDIRSTNVENVDVSGKDKTDVSADDGRRYCFESFGDKTAGIDIAGKDELVSVFCIKDGQESGPSEAKRKRIDKSDRDQKWHETSDSEISNNGRQDLEISGQNMNYMDKNDSNKQGSGTMLEDKEVIKMVDDSDKVCSTSENGKDEQSFPSSVEDTEIEGLHCQNVLVNNELHNYIRDTNRSGMETNNTNENVIICAYDLNQDSNRQVVFCPERVSTDINNRHVNHTEGENVNRNNENKSTIATDGKGADEYRQDDICSLKRDEIDEKQHISENRKHCMTSNSELDHYTHEKLNNDVNAGQNIEGAEITVTDQHKYQDTAGKQSDSRHHDHTNTNSDNLPPEKESASVEIIYSRLGNIQPVAFDIWINEHSEFHPFSDIPIQHLSMIMGLFYPKRWASNAVSMQYCKSVQGDLKIFRNPDGTLTGSMAQGLALPIMTIVDQNGRVLHQEVPDIDIMLLKKNMCVAYSNENLTTVGIIEAEQTRPGYLRLLVLNDSSIAEPFKLRDHENGNWYFNSSCVLGRFMAQAKKNQNIREDTDKLTTTSSVPYDISTHGPALMVTNTRPQENVNMSRWKDADFVFGFPCIDWPHVAYEWTIRERSHDWPPKDKLTYMCSLNCEVVGVPHKLSKNPEIEWRFSFTAAEKCISNECVTLEQRHCYMVLKILYNARLKGLGLVCSFDLKSVFFRSCENIPLKIWVDKPGACLLYMIDMLIFHVRQRFLPYYFIEKRNLLDHLGKNQFQCLEQKLCMIRQNPVTILQEFSKRHKFVFTPIFFGMEDVFKPLLSDIENYRRFNDIGKTYSAYTIGAITLATCHFLERRYDDSFNILNDAKDLLHTVEISETQNIYTMIVAVITQFPKRRTHGIEFMKHAIKSLSLSNYNLLSDLYGTLALWLHRYACDLQKRAERDDVTKQAEQNFVESLRLQIPNPFVELEYSHFLIYLDRHCEAIPYLMNVIDNERDSPTCYHVYTAADTTSVDNGIIEAVDSHNGEFIATSLSLAYFFLIKCYKKIGEIDEMTSVTEQMSSACNQLSGETSTFLLKLSKK